MYMNSAVFSKIVFTCLCRVGERCSGNCSRVMFFVTDRRIGEGVRKVDNDRSGRRRWGALGALSDQGAVCGALKCRH